MCRRCELETDELPYGFCKSCNNKRSICSKVFGKWPIAIFTNLSQESQVEFWRSEGGSREALQNQLAKTITESRVKEESDKMVGGYQPLGWYAAQGYDVKKIKKDCGDTEEHPVLGTTYKVSIRQVTWGDVKLTVEAELLSMTNGACKRDRSEEQEGDKKKKKKSKKQKTEKSPKSSSSSSKSSSSSSDDEELTPEEAKQKAWNAIEHATSGVDRCFLLRAFPIAKLFDIQTSTSRIPSVKFEASDFQVSISEVRIFKFRYPGFD
jgi:hypothetical protein